ncbi:acyl-CoA dehydrogenase family protein [Paraburkholderia piptadeniae]
MTEAFALFELCGTHVLPLPLAETMVARMLLASANYDIPAGSITLSVATRYGDRIRCGAVAFGAVSDHVLAADASGNAYLLPAAIARKNPDVFPLDAGLDWDIGLLGSMPRIAFGELRTLHACLCTAHLCGALQATLSRTLSYANERLQFGRAIGAFQAIQHQLSVMAEHVFASRIAAQLGCRGPLKDLSRLAIAVAKILTSEAAQEATSIAHAIHGAVGLSAEHDLQLFTRRLYWGRRTAGSEGYWHDVLGDALLASECRAIDMIREIGDIH